jgi:hypothetical protein
MKDSEPLIDPQTDISKEEPPSPLSDKDDFAGMFVNASKKIDFRQLLSLWLLFLMLHTEFYVENILHRFKGATDEKGNMTMKGTFYSSLIMLLGIVIIGMVFNQ